MNAPLTVGWFRPGSSSRALENSPWNWVQHQFSDLQLLDHDRLLGCLQGSARTAGSTPNVLLIGLEDRCDRMALSEIEAELAKTSAPMSGTSPMTDTSPIKRSAASRRSSVNKPMAKPSGPAASQSSSTNRVAVAFLLGNDWHGHRRTSPLPDGIPTFYWYQWYDRIYPWLTEISRRATSGPWTDASPGWRIPWLLERSNWESSVLCGHRRETHVAWVITDHGDQSDLWRDTCRTVGLQVVASRLENDPPWLDPRLIVVDCVSRSEYSERAIDQATVSARERYPDALLARVESFPTWEGWTRWQSMGVDAILPRPAALQGFLVYWQQWQSRLAA